MTKQAMPNEKLTVPEPTFDLEEFMNFSHESRISSEELNEAMRCWQRWGALLQAETLPTQDGKLLALWLPEEAEQETDSTWEKSPSQGFMLNNIAQYLCMAAVAELVPEVADLGCAPSPEPGRELEKALAQCGAQADGKMRRYAILTWKPFRGGCEICSLKQGCPRLNRSFEGMSATLPGYEPRDEV